MLPDSDVRCVRVYQLTDNAVYACKIMNKSRFVSDEKAMENFRREIQIMKTLRHPHIVQFRYVFQYIEVCQL